MSLFDDEETLLKNTERPIKMARAKKWIKEHCGKYALYDEEYDKDLYSEYNTPSSNVYPVTYVVEKKSNKTPHYYSDIQFFTRVDLDWKNFMVVLIPRDPKYKFFMRDLHDEIPDYIDLSEVEVFKVDKYKVRHE